MANKELTIQLTEILEDYSDEVQLDIDKAARNAARTGAKMLREVSPERTGKYAASWTYKAEKSRVGRTGYIIYNTRGQLTHLLENGHAIWNKPGARARGFRHIAPVRDFVERMFHQEVEEAIQR